MQVQTHGIRAAMEELEYRKDPRPRVRLCRENPLQFIYPEISCGTLACDFD